MSRNNSLSFRRVIAFGSAIGLVVAIPLTGASPVHAAVLATFNTPGAATYTVPPGVTAITVIATGGGGGGGYAATGGNGGIVTAPLSVTPGQVLNLFVGGGGVGSGLGGGGGGGSTNIDAGTANQIIAGGGGGGGGGTAPQGIGGDGNGGNGNTFG